MRRKAFELKSLFPSSLRGGLLESFFYSFADFVAMFSLVCMFPSFCRLHALVLLFALQISIVYLLLPPFRNFPPSFIPLFVAGLVSLSQSKTCVPKNRVKQAKQGQTHAGDLGLKKSM